MIRYSAAAANDSQYLKEVQLPKGFILFLTEAIYDFTTYNRFTDDGITWVTRRRKLFSYKVLKQYKITVTDGSVVSDEQVQLGWRSGIKVIAKLVIYKDLVSGEQYEFISNNFKMRAENITGLYQKRWQIELLFKRMKQNYPLKYFLGDSENSNTDMVFINSRPDFKNYKKRSSIKMVFLKSCRYGKAPSYDLY